MKTLLRMMAFVSAFALAYVAPVAASATVAPAVTITQAPNYGMTLSRSATFETGTAAVESFVEVNTACSSRITLFSMGGSMSPHTPLLSVYAAGCTGALTIQALIGGTNRILHSTTNLSTGVPEYVTASYDGTTLSMTLNGTVIASQTFTGSLGPVASASSVGLGRSYDTFADNFPGSMWSTKIYSSGLTNGQIATDYAAAPTTPPYGTSLNVPIGVTGALVTAPIFSSSSSVSLGAKVLSGQILSDSPAAFYRLNESGGTSAYDSSGNNLTATYSTTVVSSSSLAYPATGPILVPTEPEYSTFIPDNSGTPSSLAVTIPDSTTFLRPTTTLSAEAVILPDNYGGSTTNGIHYVLFSGDTTSAPNGAWSMGLNNGIPYARVSNTGTTGVTVSASTIVPANRMTHLAFTYDGSTIKLYVNGGLSATGSASGTVHGYTTAGTQIGTDNQGGGHFGGYIADVAIYGTTLSASKIASHSAIANGYTLPSAADYTTTQPINANAPVPRMVGWSSWSGPPVGVTMNQTLWSILANYVSYDDRISSSLVSTAVANGIAPGFYFDPNQKCTLASDSACGGVNLASSYNESSFAHDCSGNRVYLPYPNTGHNTLTDPRNPTLAANINSVDIDPMIPAGYTFANADNFNLRSLYSTNIGSYSGGSATSPQPYCGYSDPSYLAGSRQTVTQLDLPIAFNGANGSQIASGLGLSQNTFAAICELCFTSSTHNKEWLQGPYGPLWLDRVDSELITGKLGKILDVKLDGTSYLLTNDIQGYVLASTLIGWSPSVTISMLGSTPESLQAPFFPGINLIPMNPVVPLSAILQASSTRYGDVYLRAYRDCYLYGKNVGKCVAIVNPDQTHSANVPVDFQTGYSHAITVDNVNDASCLTDSGVCYKNSITELGDTGALVESSATPATTLPASGWEILVQ